MCQTTIDNLQHSELIGINSNMFGSTFFGQLMNRYLLHLKTMNEFAEVST